MTQQLNCTELNQGIRASQVALVVKNPPAKQETEEMWVQFLGWEDPPEEGIANHSSILAWEFPWTEKPARYSPWCR